MVQFPGNKINHALVIQGPQGIGKSFLAHVMERLLGGHNVVTVDTAELHTQFNGWAKGAQLAVFEEIMALGRKEIMNKLKAMITQPHFRINEKYIPPYDMQNRMNFLLFSNHIDALLLDDDDRRYFVAASTAEAKKPDYYTVLFGWFDKNAGVVLDFLLKRDLSSFNPKAHPPSTEAKRQTIAAGRPAYEIYLREKFEAGEWPLGGDLAVPTHIADILPSNARTNASRISSVLSSLGGLKLGQKRDKDERKPTFWAMRDQENWRHAGEEEIRKHYTRPIIKNGVQTTDPEPF